MNARLSLIFLFLFSAAFAQVGPATPLEAVPLVERIQAQTPAPYDGTLRCHTITWGPDFVPWTLQEEGAFAARGLDVTHTNEDVIAEQIEAYLSDHVCLRGTVEQVVQVADALHTAGLEAYAPVVSLIHSFSAGGDVIVGGAEVNRVEDLCGATVAAQRDGPSLALLVNVVADACPQGFADLNILWTEDFVGFQGVSSPGAALLEGLADAALVITPDALALTGEGEYALPGANIVIGTDTARRAVADVVAFRKDFIETYPDIAQAYVETVLTGHETVAQAQRGEAYETLLEVGAAQVLDLPGNLEEAELLLKDAEIVRMPGNVAFFTQPGNPVGFEGVARRAQANLRQLGLLSGTPFTLEQANWNYQTFSPDLLAVEGVALPEIDPTRAAAAVQNSDRLFCFAVTFAPEQTDFPVEVYRADFDRAIRQAAIFPNVLFTLEGNMSVNRFVRLYREGAEQPVLTRMQQQARSTSYARAESVLEGLNAHAEAQGVGSFRPDQFVIIGNGIENPQRGFDANGVPVPAATEAAWNADRNVSVCATTIQVEDETFVPLD